MGQNFQFLQVLIVLIVLAFSGLTWVWRKIEEQRARRRRMLDQQRRMEEMLRTGRDPLAEQAAALERATATDRARLEELMRRRQAQMEQLRREQMQRRQEAEQASSRGGEIPPIIIMGPSGPIAIPRAQPAGGQTAGGTRPPMGRPAPARGVQTRPAPYGPQQRPAQRQQRQKREKSARTEPAAPERRTLVAQPTPAPAEDIAPPRRARTLAPLRVGRGMSREEYRRLIASLELLRPPLALRPPELDLGPSPLI